MLAVCVAKTAQQFRITTQCSHSTTHQYIFYAVCCRCTTAVMSTHNNSRQQQYGMCGMYTVQLQSCPDRNEFIVGNFFSQCYCELCMTETPVACVSALLGYLQPAAKLVTGDRGHGDKSRQLTAAAGRGSRRRSAACPSPSTSVSVVHSSQQHYEKKLTGMNSFRSGMNSFRTLSPQFSIISIWNEFIPDRNEFIPHKTFKSYNSPFFLSTAAAAQKLKIMLPDPFPT